MSSKTEQKKDAGESAFLARELEAIKPEIVARVYPDMNYAVAMPVSPIKNPAAEFITYRMIDRLGFAKIIASYADDIPRVDVEMREYSVRARRLAAAAGYTFDELLAAQATGRPIDSTKVDVAAETIMRLIDKLAFLGDTATGLVGLTNVPNMPNTVVSNVSGAVTWDAKLALGTEAGIRGILNDLNAPFTRVRGVTKGTESCNAVAISPSALALISQALMPNTDGTVLEYFLKAHPGVAIVESTWLETSGTGGTRQMIVYRRDPSKLTLEIPQDLVLLDPQQRNLEEIVIATAKFGGLQVKFPLSMDSSYGM